MTRTRKISVRKVLRACLTFLVTTGCFVAVVGASRMQRDKTLREIDLQIQNNQYQFLDHRQLWQQLVEEKGIKKGMSKMQEIDISAIEKKAYTNQWVEKADVFVDNKKTMHIAVRQRVPVARIFMENGNSYYLDSTLRLLPLSDYFTSYATIVTNVPATSNDSIRNRLFGQIVRLVKYVDHDTFWRAQIAQISVTPQLNFELTPVLGTHKILLGEPENLKEKFDNLFAFYTKVLNRIGWDRYQLLDLRFKNQIVASPPIPWKPQTRNAISNMDWVKNIVGEAEPTEARVEVMAPPQTAPAAISSANIKELEPTIKPERPTPPTTTADHSSSTSIEPKQLTPQKKETGAQKTPVNHHHVEPKKEEQAKPGKYIYQRNENN